MTGATPVTEQPVYYHTVGVVLAIFAGFFVGSSLILQKKGLMDTRLIGLETGNEASHEANISLHT